MTDILALLQPIQNSAPKEMLGRMMSLLMFSGTGLAPISQAIAGVLSKWNLTLVFALPGVLVLLMTVWIALQPELKASARASQARPTWMQLFLQSTESPAVPVFSVYAGW